ncbi:MAG: hypothetical protein Kow00133_03350 [Amphiplicatus sp.]
MRVKFPLTGAALLAAMSCATTASERVDEKVVDKLAGLERTGEKVTCLNVRNITSIDAADEKTFLVRVGVNDYYVNEARGRCSGATQTFNHLEYTITTTQLCKLDIIRVMDNQTGTFYGSCSLGEFEKLAEKAPADENDAS